MWPRQALEPGQGQAAALCSLAKRTLDAAQGRYPQAWQQARQFRACCHAKPSGFAARFVRIYATGNTMPRVRCRHPRNCCKPRKCWRNHPRRCNYATCRRCQHRHRQDHHHRLPDADGRHGFAREADSGETLRRPIIKLAHAPRFKFSGFIRSLPDGLSRGFPGRTVRVHPGRRSAPPRTPV